jgi:hypothetical protein
MKSDTLIRVEGMEALMEKLDLVDAERFIMLIKKEPFDYTKWQETLFEGMSVEEISADAAALRARTEKREKLKTSSSKIAAAKKSAGRRKQSNI